MHMHALQLKARSMRTLTRVANRLYDEHYTLNECRAQQERAMLLSLLRPTLFVRSGSVNSVTTNPYPIAINVLLQSP